MGDDPEDVTFSLLPGLETTWHASLLSKRFLFEFSLLESNMNLLERSEACQVVYIFLFFFRDMAMVQHVLLSTSGATTARSCFQR